MGLGMEGYAIACRGVEPPLEGQTALVKLGKAEEEEKG